MTTNALRYKVGYDTQVSMINAGMQESPNFSWLVTALTSKPSSLRSMASAPSIQLLALQEGSVLVRAEWTSGGAEMC